MSYFKVLNEIKQGNIANVYLLFGTESFFIQNITKKLSTAVLGDEKENLSTYDLTEIPIEHVVQDAETYPFFGERKMIIASNATFLQARPAKLAFEHELENLEQYLKQPSESSVLVLTAPFESIDGRKTMTKQLKKYARFIECMPVSDRQLHEWILKFAEHSNIQIDEEAVQLLAANLPNDLHLLQNELDKYAQYVGEGQTITKDVILKLISHLPMNTALELAETVINRDLTKAMYIYRDLKLNNEKAIGLIALLAYQFRIILQVKLLKSKGYTEFQMRKKISAHPYVIKLAYDRERRFSLETLKIMFDQLTETDAKIKRGQMDENIAFEQLLLKLITAA